MESAAQVQILDEAVYISLKANTFEKSMNSSVLHPAMVNSKAGCVLYPWLHNQSWRRKSLNSNLLYSTLCHIYQ